MHGAELQPARGANRPSVAGQEGFAYPPAVLACRAGLPGWAGSGGRVSARQLGRSLVKADHRPLRVMEVGRTGPARPPCGPRTSALTLGMHHSCFCHGLREFFSGAAAISWDREGSNPNYHLSRQKAQGTCPSGGSEQARAMRLASPRSSSFRYR